MNELINEPFEKPTFKRFLKHDQIMNVAEHAHTKQTWDFNYALGDTIKEKYENLYIKCVDLNSELLRQGAKGYFWIVTSPEVASIFETCTYGFSPSREDEYDSDLWAGGVAPQGLPGIAYCGTVYSKWRLYKDYDLTNEIIMGCNDKPESYNHYGVLTVENFII